MFFELDTHIYILSYLLLSDKIILISGRIIQAKNWYEAKVILSIAWTIFHNLFIYEDL